MEFIGLRLLGHRQFRNPARRMASPDGFELLLRRA
nr:MAG TPA: hypothetical protein [Caudoviricetes sp.]